MSVSANAVAVSYAGAARAQPSRDGGPSPDGFGASAPLKDLTRRFGFTPEAVVERAREQAAAYR